MLYFSSTYLGNKTFQSLEELFQNIHPENTVLVYDTNIIIYYRSFYLNPKQFITNPANKEIFHALEYLNKHVTMHNLEVAACLGIDESSRKKSDFSVNKAKYEQTHEAIMNLIYMNYRNLDEFIRVKTPQEPVIDDGIYPENMLPILEQESFYQNSLIVMYALCLKVILLHNKFESNEINRREAMEEFTIFMQEKIGFASGIIYSFCLHLFGGASDFKSIIFPKNKLKNNEKLHKILNGAIDLVFPTLINKRVSIIYNKSIPDLIPVFVSTDKRISILHGLMQTLAISSTELIPNYSPELVQANFLDGLKWTKAEWNHLSKILQSHINSYDGAPRMTTHLLKYIKPLESELIRYWQKG